jgi:hypothetical protein
MIPQAKKNNTFLTTVDCATMFPPVGNPADWVNEKIKNS